MNEDTQPTADDRELIVVTGSGGLIGSQLVERFSRDFRLVGMDLHGPEVPMEGCGLDSTRPDQGSQWSPRHQLALTLPRMIDTLKRDPEPMVCRQQSAHS